MNQPELPIGFGFALAQNPEAMQAFARLPEPSQSEIVERARAVSSKEEMRALVNELCGHPLSPDVPYGRRRISPRASPCQKFTKN